MQITGIILAGGLNTRMGTDKALIKMGGKTLLEKAIEICKPVCKSIIISSNNKNHEFCGYQITPDEIKNCGPLGGIYSCLIKSDTDWNFVISVDAAFVTVGFIEFLISEVNNNDAVIPEHSNGNEPLIALYHKNCIPAILKQIETKDYKMQNLFKSLNTKYTEVQKWVEMHPVIFNNLNRPEDLKI